MKNQNNLIVFFLTVVLMGTWSGQTILDIGFVGLMIVWLFSSYKTFKQNPSLKWQALGLRKCGVDWLFLAYFVIACLGYAFNGREGAEPMRYLPRFATLLQIYVLMWVFERISLNTKSFLKVLAIATLYPAIYSIILWYNQSAIDPFYRTIGLVKSSIQHAFIGGFFIVLFGAVYIKQIRHLANKEKIIYALSFLIILLATVMTRTRTALIVLVFTAGLFILSYFNMKIRVCLVMLGLVLAGAFWASPYKQIVFRKASDICRVQLYKVHFDMIKDKPLLGIGYLDNYREVKDYWPVEEEWTCPVERQSGVHAHNQYVNVAATTGIPSLIIFLSIFGYFLILTVRLLKQAKAELKVFALTALLAQIYFMLIGMAEIPFEFAKIRMLILLVWAWVTVAYSRSKSEMHLVSEL